MPPTFEPNSTPTPVLPLKRTLPAFQVAALTQLTVKPLKFSQFKEYLQVNLSICTTASQQRLCHELSI